MRRDSLKREFRHSLRLGLPLPRIKSKQGLTSAASACLLEYLTSRSAEEGEVMFLEKLIEDLPGIPSFEPFLLRDRNPLGRTMKLRVCQKQNEAMKILHQRLIKYLRTLNIELSHATGCRIGNSPVKNVRIHRKNRFFFLTDIQDAFLNVDGRKLALVLCSLDPRLAGKQEEVFVFLRKYCLSPNDGLVIGATASQDLFNIYAGILIDLQLVEISRRHGLIYTRYLDDLTFSSSKIPIGKRKRRFIRTIVEKTGFVLNDRKSRVLDLKKGTIEINGVGLEWEGRIFLPRDYTRKILGLLHSALNGKDIDPNKIHGIMGVFFDLTERKDPNQIERKIIQKYQAYRRLIKWGIKT